MNKQEKIEKTNDFIKTEFSGDSTGHDWWHIDRVRNTAINLATNEGADLYITEMAALLHDLDDWKFNDSDLPLKAYRWLENIGETEHLNAIIYIVANVSYKGAGVKDKPLSLEGQCVQDADRLDAIGAVGIARTFAYGGAKGNEIFNPDVAPEMHGSFDDYKTKTSHTINHFYEKLLLLKDRINTQSGKKLANERHAFMLVYLEQFYAEWKGIA